MGIESFLTEKERQLLTSLDSPHKIQVFINSIPYSDDHFYRCPLRVLRDRKAHCFDGALFAAMVLRRIGYPPRILELIPNERDDDHLLALFKHQGLWGAVAKSNFSGLRYREPIYRTLRELVMSYFEDFFNTAGEKTLRGYRGPIHLGVFDQLEWENKDDELDTLSDGIDRYPIQFIITNQMASDLSPVDDRNYHAGLMGANPAGLFKADQKDD
jgi:hypothetical protein